ncbi:DEKNAAC102350 [Brettanomyces naardenensis]|uniref:Palmitoyl-protein thioesterase 1 n=1 Tax=Brettanomyces naardenensis TaxID=13370 RepID=A0A448YKA1_BRENA|nr:DEKNAAC102350 [Brettanomyces naardenensis]
MGDTYNSEFMQWVNRTLDSYIPGIETYSVRVEEDGREDQEASIVGDAMTEVLGVCDQLRNISQLNEGFNAIGFSQGGLFLRSAMEVCGLPIHNLITYGSPHNGFVDLPVCKDWLCRKRNKFLKQHLYDSKVQDSLIQAQYFRDVYNYDDYIEKSIFLKFVNNEFIANRTYAENLSKLNKLAMVMFTKDVTVVPKESAWYYDIDPDTDRTTSFTETMGYKDDLIGMKTLHKQGRIDFLQIENAHMQIDEDDLALIAGRYL